MKRCGSHLVWEAWTDFGSVGVGRTAALGKSDRISQDLTHPRVDPPSRGAPATARNDTSTVYYARLKASNLE